MTHTQETGLANGVRLPRVTIAYCTGCRWLLRGAWYTQELLTTFGDTLAEVALQPATGGTFIVTLYTQAGADTTATRRPEASVDGVDEWKLWDRKERGGFPEAKELKQLVRDVISPDRSLGHADRKTERATTTTMSGEDKLDFGREKRAVKGHEEKGVDGPVNTLDEKPADNTTTRDAVREAEDLPDGPVTRIDEPNLTGKPRKSTAEIKQEARPVGSKAESECKDCE
ncbi:hypothetical protein PYCC9005_003845 [Savitreella phatthalungensis]